MIAKLTGLVDSVAADHAVIDVGGVGYLVHASRRTLAALGPAGSPAAVVVETVMRDDRITLFGFAAARERDWFRLLTGVQGVGPRMALAILGVLAPGDLATAIAAGDRAALGRADGVGPKLAQRVIGELKDKAGALAAPAPAAAGTAPVAAVAPAGGDAADRAVEDAVSALVNLGYGRTEAFTAIARVRDGLAGQPTVEALIPAALKALAP